MATWANLPLDNMYTPSSHIGRSVPVSGFLFLLSTALPLQAARFTWGGGDVDWSSTTGWTRPGGSIGQFPGDDQNGSDSATINSGTVTLTQGISRNHLDVSLTGGSLVLQADLQPGRIIEVSGGVLNVASNQSNAAVMATGGIVTGTGTVGGNGSVTFASGSTHAPGGIGVVGAQAIGNNSVYQAGSTFSWDISSATTFDTVVSNSSQVSGGAIVVNVLGIDFGASFWDSNQAFVVSNFQNGAWFTSLTVNGATSGGNFTLGNPDAGNGSTKNYIYWDTNAAPNNGSQVSPVPEAGSSICGLLLATGLLRRRKR